MPPPAAPPKNFQEWIHAHKHKPTLLQQVELARQLYDDSVEQEENAPTGQQIIRSLENTPIQALKSLVTWQGIRVDWFLNVFCKFPYIQKLQEFGCELWFVRKVCIIEMMRRAYKVKYLMSNKEQDATLSMSGPLVRHIETCRTYWEGESTERAAIVADSNRFISYSGSYTLTYLLEMIGQLPGEEYMWMDIFCVDQFAWTGKGRSPEFNSFRQAFMDDLETSIQKIGRTALILKRWDDVMITLQNMWVLWEVFNTAEAKGAEMNVLLPQSQVKDFLENCLETDTKFDSILTSLASIDANNATTEIDTDREIIFKKMKEKGLTKVNTMVISKMRGWLIDMGQARLQQLRREQQPDGRDGNQKVDLSEFLNQLASLLQAQGQLEAAEELFREALDDRRSRLGRQDQDLFVSIGNMATVLRLQGKLAEAEPLYQEDLNGCRKLLGNHHPDTLVSMDNMASLLQDMERLDDAEELFQEALEGRRQSLGSSHPATLTSINNAANLLEEKGNLDEAEALYREGLQGCHQRLGKHHPLTLTTTSNLASVLSKQGKLDEAEQLFREDLSGCRQILGDDHPTSRESALRFALFLDKQGRLDDPDLVSCEHLIATFDAAND